jgi:hypothetical protein
MSSESECVRRNILFGSENPGCVYQPVLGRDTWVRDASPKGRIVQGAHRKKEASYQGVIVKETYAPRNSYGRRQYIPGHIVIASKYRARNNQLQKLRKMIFSPHCTENPIYVFPINETARPRSQFVHSCICEEFINFQVRSAYLAASK